MREASSRERSQEGQGGKAVGLKWDQAEEIAEVLTENHPGLDPMDVRFTDLRQWVVDLDEFDDDPNGSNEPKLEAIQMAWHEIYEEQSGEDDD
jgi:FeS assembly protein IscX